MSLPSNKNSASVWTQEVLAVLQKETLVEFRGKTGIATSAVFGLSTVVTIALALFNKNVNEAGLSQVCASLVWIVILFASLLSLPRTFLGEEELKTADLLRLTARPHAVFWGKSLFNLIQMWILCAIVSFLFIAFTGINVYNHLTLAGCLLAGSAAAVGAVSVCGAIAAQASNRAALAATIAIPLVLIPAQWGVSGLNDAFQGSFATHDGATAILGLFAYATLSIGLGPWIYAAIWKS